MDGWMLVRTQCSARRVVCIIRHPLSSADGRGLHANAHNVCVCGCVCSLCRGRTASIYKYVLREIKVERLLSIATKLNYFISDCDLDL